ncbi:MAG: MBL fold metallo-hydrolase [Phaeodactylibacter sp.]|uniref:MBL fold metallo-hydrolase n=1 Tax=Phaeodactylibacter sp. TaxID=1940289 RepID=UPI0032EBB26E
MRTAALIQVGDKHIAVDCGPDFRAQMLRAGISRLDAILITHQHNDHIIGLDDVRPFNFRNDMDMPVFCTVAVEAELKQRFAYIFETQNRYPGAPQVQLRRISKASPFEVEGQVVRPVELMHGRMPVLGFRLGGFAYLTDVRTIAPEEFAKVKNLDTLVLSALHHSEHHSHLNLKQALALIEQLSPRQAYLIHMSHRMGLHQEVSQKLPENVALGYDGLTFTVD